MYNRPDEALDVPAIVSYFRTGAHWLTNCIMEYFNAKVYLHNGNRKWKKVMAQHTHDATLGEKYKEVIYVWRDPVDVIYSNIMFFHHGRLLSYPEEIINRSMQYGYHLKKWKEEDFSEKKLIITYEKLQLNFDQEFEKVIKFFSGEVDKEKIAEMEKRITKKYILKIAGKRMIKDAPDYEKKRDAFRKIHGELINKVVGSIQKYGREHYKSR